MEIMVYTLNKIFIINIYDNYQYNWKYRNEILPRKCLSVEKQDPCSDSKIL